MGEFTEFWSAVSLVRGYMHKDPRKARHYLEVAHDAVKAEDEEYREGRKSLLDKFSLALNSSSSRDLSSPVINKSPALEKVATIDASAAIHGTTLVTCCKNRNENLLKALPSWLDCEEIDEILIVDWDSETPVSESIEKNGLSDPRVRVVRVNGQPRWVLSYAFNLGFRLARYSKILKVDADIVLSEDFFVKNTLSEKAFVTGDWRIAEAGQEYINGFFYAWKSDLLAIKGFNEYITTYGWDDDDIYGRLEAIELIRDRVDPKTIHHLPHGDEQRLNVDLGAPKSALTEIKSDTSFSIFTNKILCEVTPAWNKDRKYLPFAILERSDSYMELEQADEPPHFVSSSVADSCKYLALKLLASWKLGPDVYKLDNVQLTSLLESNSFEEIRDNGLLKDLVYSSTSARSVEKSDESRKLYIDAQHGLGNRLRAIASAAAIAEIEDKELVIVWEPDHHCDAKFSDLFDYDGPVIERAFVERARKEGCLYNYMEVELDAKKNQHIEVSSNTYTYVRSAYTLVHPSSTWDKENEFLKSLKPSQRVLDLISEISVSDCLAVHVRMEAGEGLDHHSYDSVENWTEEGHKELHFWREKSHYSAFLKRIDALIEADSELKIFLATDMAETYKVFSNYYGDRVCYLNRSVFDRSAEQIVYALADALLLSGCRKLLGSTWSSFSELAMRLSNTYSEIEMSGRDF
ncbi:glycosyltransferase [Microbulbifer agarilyticus]|uniref:glycosyltransferase n=1 Tax=Microbulbifer agarilyticus TaxID=260552 RepID=UPI001C95A192|nr:galactosyltransferase-related protein [Microbulbifer agarilyticus]MBY6212236.1 glycosyltransferase [Microbulbifer agarilyticus]